MINLSLNQDFADSHFITLVPRWVDVCNHDKSTYLCSFACYNFKKGKSVEELYDFYLFKDRLRFASQSVCLRYGNEGHEYISPGSLLDFIKTASRVNTYSNPYFLGLKILETYGDVIWEQLDKSGK